MDPFTTIPAWRFFTGPTAALQAVLAQLRRRGAGTQPQRRYRAHLDRLLHLLLGSKIADGK